MNRLLFPIFVLLGFLGCAPSPEPSGIPDVPPQRVISTLPSITEVLFDIGLGNRIVGDSPFTKYPPESAHIDKIGGLYDSNHEKIISLKPDLVILSIENKTLLQSLSAPVLVVDHRSLSGVLDSYLVIGKIFGEDILTVAQTKRQELFDNLNSFEASVKGKDPIRTLISTYRSYGTGRIQGMYVAGTDSFLTEVVERAGGENVAAAIGLPTRLLSEEGVRELSPDVIIDIQFEGKDLTQSLSDWQSLGSGVPAVRNHHILVLSDDFSSIPGPRTPLLIGIIARYFESIE